LRDVIDRQKGGDMLQVKNVLVEKLTLWKDNPRQNKQAVRAVVKSVKAFGFNVPILCDEGLRIIAGHTRLEAAKRLKMKSVPVITLPLSDQDSKRFAIAENKTGELADWDTPKLKSILDELHSEDLDLGSLGFSQRELRRLLKIEDMRENAIPKTSTRTRTATGTLWKLGRHRVLCGDSRHKKTFTRLLGRTKVDHVFAGPPYFNQRAYSHWDDYAKYLRDMDAVMARCQGALKAGGIVVWNIGNGSSTNQAHVVHHAGLLEENGFRFVDMIVWRKCGANYDIPRHMNIKKHRNYYPSHQWEALHVYQKPGKMSTMSSECVFR
jgi:hypothetical protein